MSAPWGRGITNLQTAGAYIPSLLLFWIYFETGVWIHGTLAAASLLSAVTFHGVIRSVWGPGGPEENPITNQTGIQRLLVLMTNRGPANRFPRSPIDAALNSGAYAALVSRRRQLFFVLLFLLDFVVWPISIVVVFYEGAYSIHNASLPILILYFALVAWLLQQFVVWNRFSPVYYMEENRGEGYTFDSINAVSHSKPKPDRPAKGMNVRDGHLLAILRDSGIPVTSNLVGYHYCKNQLGGEGIRVSFKAARGMVDIDDMVRERLESLSEMGLVRTSDPEMYELTELGHAYLGNEIDAEWLEEHVHSED